MKQTTKKLMEKVQEALIEKSYLTAKQLAEICHIKISTIYRIIRLMRLEGIGVLPAKNGYVLAEFAKQSDDVHFVRCCYGRRVSDNIIIQSILPHVEKRWKSISDKTTLKSLLSPMSMNASSLKGMRILLSYKNSKGL
jgi:Fe2+ or Zn2+ uptake regulation protein